MKTEALLPSRSAACVKRMLLIAAFAGSSFTLFTAPSIGGVMTVPSGNGLGGGGRWDAATRDVFVNGICCEDRSLNGTLTYALQGGSYSAYRDLFTWSGGTPSASAFQAAVEQAFGAWTVVDPVSHFGTSLAFTYAPSITPVGFGTGALIRGAEIDLFGRTATDRWAVGNGTTQGETTIDLDPGPVKLTSGTSNYLAPAVVAADIAINSNPQAAYSLDVFRRLLTHEIGHALGLLDVGPPVGTVSFIDNNFSAADPAGTLNDSWAHLVDPLDPAASGPALQAYSIAQSVFQMSGVDLLMESQNLGIGGSNPVTNLTPLTNDEYGMRQFLYPELAPVPEPHEYLLLGAGLATVIARVRKLRKRNS